MVADTDKNIVVLTGAGISKESGLETFRDANGIWSQVRIEDVATPGAFARDPARVHAFYNARREVLVGGGIQPNPAHLALALLEDQWPGNVLVVTQNIDDLHEKAGSRNLIHMHGELLKVRCGACSMVHHWPGSLSAESRCPSCTEMGALRPDVVWFGETPMDMEKICAALARCTLFVSIGTSGTVYPAAGFVGELKNRSGVRTVELNLEASEGTSLFDEARYGPASEIVPTYIDEMMDDR